MNSIENPSHWHHASGLHYPLAALPAQADAVVVGGGVLGVATVYWLARAGAAPLLLERGPLAAGATGRNGGLLVPGTAEDYAGARARLGHATARAVWAFSVAGCLLTQQVLAEEGIACDYRMAGQLNLALNEAQFVGYQHTVELLRADGFVAELLDRQETQEQIGTPLSAQVLGGKFLPQGAMVHSAKLVQGLAEAAVRHGARIATGVTVQGLQPEAGSTVLATDQGPLRAGALVLALNSWSGDLLPALREQITPVRGQVLAYAPTQPVFRYGMGAALTPTGEYWQQTPDGSIVLGGCRALAAERDVGVRETGTTAEVQAALEAVLPQLFPRLTGLRVARRWSGTMGFTPDYLPIVDRVPGLPATLLAGGFSGHGMPFGLVLGQRLAAAVTGGWHDDLALFRLDRPTLQGDA